MLRPLPLKGRWWMAYQLTVHTVAVHVKKHTQQSNNKNRPWERQVAIRYQLVVQLTLPRLKKKNKTTSITDLHRWQ